MGRKMLSREGGRNQGAGETSCFSRLHATRHGDRAAARLARRDTRIVRLRPAIEGEDWNDMLMRERAGEPLETDLRPLD